MVNEFYDGIPEFDVPEFDVPKFDIPEYTVPNLGLSHSAFAGIIETQNKISAAFNSSALRNMASACSTLTTAASASTTIPTVCSSAIMPGCISALQSVSAATTAISSSLHNEAIESALGATSAIASSIDHSALCGIAATSTALANSLHSETLESALGATSEISSSIDNSAFKGVAATSASIAASLHNEALDTIAETNTRIAEAIHTSVASSIGNALNSVVELFAGVGALMTNAMTEALNSMSARMNELRSRMGNMIEEIIDRIHDFFVYRLLQHWLTPAILFSMRVLQYIKPPIKIKFCNFAYKIRRIYLARTRERGSSDDEDNNYHFCNPAIVI